jgi:nucleotide-binding universal stress UspA family protein
METLERPPVSGGLVVGYDGSDEANDALALGRLLGGALGAELVLACVYPPGFSTVYVGDRALEGQLRVAAERQLAAAPGADELRREAVVAESPARGLIDAAERDQARLLVVGPRTAAEPASCCSAAWRARSCTAQRVRSRWRHVASRAVRGLVAVVHSGELFPAPAWIGFGDARFANAVHEHHQRELDRGLAHVPDRIEANGVVTVGEPAHALEDEAAQRGLELLVVGSRGYGPVRRVLLGSVASELLHNAPCPVIVCPRGSHPEAADEPAGPEAARAPG